MIKNGLIPNFLHKVRKFVGTRHCSDLGAELRDIGSTLTAYKYSYDLQVVVAGLAVYAFEFIC